MTSRALTLVSSIVVLLLGIGASLPALAQEADYPTNPEAERLSARVTELVAAGRYQQAVPLAEQAARINEQVFGAAAPATGFAVFALGRLYCLTGEYAKAEPLLQGALLLAEQLLEPADPLIAGALSALGTLYSDLGAYARAKPMLERAVAMLEEQLGPTDTQVAEAVNNLAILYRNTGDYAQAQALLQRALAIQEQQLGPEAAATALALGNLASLYVDSGAYPPALPLYERALAINEKVLGAEHPSTAATLINMAVLYQATGEYSQAEGLAKRALSISEKLGPEHPSVAVALNNFGALYSYTGAYATALPLFERALAINEKVLGTEHPTSAATVTNLAGLFSTTGEYSKAEALLQRACASYEKSLGPEHPSTALALSKLADLYGKTGAYTNAAMLLERALAIHVKALGDEHPTTAVALNNLAEIYNALGAYTRAEPLLQRALAINEKVLGPDHPTTSNALTSLATMYVATGAYGKAEPLYLRALSVAEKALGATHPSITAAINNLANLYRLQGEHAQAEPLLQRALTINEKALGPQHPDLAFSLSVLGELYRLTGGAAKAEALHRRALAIYETAFGGEHPAIAMPLNNLALLYWNLGEHIEAEALLQRALTITQNTRGPEHPDSGRILRNLALLYTARAEPDTQLQAEAMIERAQAVDEANVVRFLLSGSESRKLQYLRQLASSTSVSVALSLTHASPRRTALALTEVLRYKGRALDATSNSIAQLRRSAAAEDLQLLEQLAKVARELANLAFSGPGTMTEPVFRARFDTLKEQEETLQTQLASRSAALAQALTPITLDSIRHAMPADTVLLEWARYEPVDLRAKPAARSGASRYMVYILGHDGDPVAIDVGEAKLIDNLILQFRSALTNPLAGTRGANRADSAPVSIEALARELSVRLITPLRAHLPRDRRLVISPDGILNLLPFAALLDEAGQYLVQSFEISYVTSGRDLLRIAAEVPSGSAVVVLGDPMYGDASLAGQVGVQAIRSGDLDRSKLVFNRLAGTYVEAKTLQSLFKLDEKQVLTAERATEGALRSLQGPRILHLATHGFFLEDQQAAALFSPLANFGTASQASSLTESPLLRSGLALAGANERSSTGADDGILTALEMAQLNLFGTELVVLSACETALGTIAAGEGVYGLRRALVLAGAQSQLVSLWKVDDAATQGLITEYYQHLLKGEGRAAALRAVQRSMLADPARANPYYWAAFIPIGKWTPLSKPQSLLSIDSPRTMATLKGTFANPFSFYFSGEAHAIVQGIDGSRAARKGGIKPGKHYIQVYLNNILREFVGTIELTIPAAKPYRLLAKRKKKEFTVSLVEIDTAKVVSTTTVQVNKLQNPAFMALILLALP